MNLFRNAFLKGFKYHRNIATRFWSSTRASVDNRFAIIETNEGESKVQFKYPLVWLRDNCQCNECFHAESSSRTLNWEKFSFQQAKPKAVEVNVNNSDDNRFETKKKNFFLDRKRI